MPPHVLVAAVSVRENDCLIAGADYLDVVPFQ